MQELELKHFSGQTEARLLKVNYDVLPISVGTTVNLTVEDEVVISKVEEKSVTFECSRTLVMDPKSIFEAKATCYVKRVLNNDVTDIDLTSIDLNTFVQQNLANLVNTAFSNMAYLLASITNCFGGSPFLTPPIPTPNTRIIRKV